jgi:hypothetical protein
VRDPGETTGETTGGTWPARKAARNEYPARQVEDLAQAAAVDTEAFTPPPPPPCADQALGLQADGKGIVMLPGSLRLGTAAQAAKTSPRLATRLSPGEARPQADG